MRVANNNYLYAQYNLRVVISPITDVTDPLYVPGASAGFQVVGLSGGLSTNHGDIEITIVSGTMLVARTKAHPVYSGRDLIVVIQKGSLILAPTLSFAAGFRATRNVEVEVADSAGIVISPDWTLMGRNVTLVSDVIMIQTGSAIAADEIATLGPYSNVTLFLMGTCTLGAGWCYDDSWDRTATPLVVIYGDNENEIYILDEFKTGGDFSVYGKSIKMSAPTNGIIGNFIPPSSSPRSL